MKLFSTQKSESGKKKVLRLVFNVAPVIRGTGSWIKFLSDDWHEMHVSLPLSLRTRNYVGTQFGGAMFAAADPWYMIMLYNILGKSYIVWDKSAQIKFIRPGKGKLKGRFYISQEEVHQIKSKVESQKEVQQSFVLEWLNAEGKVVAQVEKLIYIADKAFYKSKKRNVS